MYTAGGRAGTVGRPRGNRSGRASYAASRVATPGQDLRRSTEMEVGRGQHRDTTVPMLVVVPRKQGPAERMARVGAWEPTREARVVLQRLELSLAEGLDPDDLGDVELRNIVSRYLPPSSNLSSSPPRTGDTWRARHERRS
jgi:hypothetical protein